MRERERYEEEEEEEEKEEVLLPSQRSLLGASVLEVGQHQQVERRRNFGSLDA